MDSFQVFNSSFCSDFSHSYYHLVNKSKLRNKQVLMRSEKKRNYVSKEHLSAGKSIMVTTMIVR